MISRAHGKNSLSPGQLYILVVPGADPLLLEERFLALARWFQGPKARIPTLLFRDVGHNQGKHNFGHIDYDLYISCNQWFISDYIILLCVFVSYLAALLVYSFVEVFEAVHLVAQKSCSDATMIFKQEANINRLNLNQSNWTDRLPMMCSWLIVMRGEKFEWFRMRWYLWRACSTAVNWNTPKNMLAEFTCESFSRTVLPFTLAKGTEACYFQLRQDFRLTKILTLCKLKTCHVCLGLVKLQFYKRKSQLKPDLCPPNPVWREAAVWTFIWWHGSLALMLPWLSGRKPTSVVWTSTNQVGRTAYQWCAVGR